MMFVTTDAAISEAGAQSREEHCHRVATRRSHRAHRPGEAALGAGLGSAALGAIIGGIAGGGRGAGKGAIIGGSVGAVGGAVASASKRERIYEAEFERAWCIGGGSGIAGMMSILSRACQENYFNDHKGYLFFGIRTLKDCFYLSELSEFAAVAGDNLEITLVLSEEDAGLKNHPGALNLRLDHGFAHEAVSRSMAGRYDKIIGYVAGPPPMVDASLRVLIAEGKLPVSDIRYDKFS